MHQLFIWVLSTSFEFHQSRTKSCDGFLQLWSPYCGWCWQIQDWQKLDILHRAAPDRAEAVWAIERAKYSGFYYNISNSVFFYSVSVINILYRLSGSEERLNTMSILTFEDCSSGSGRLMLQWFRLRNGINFIRHVAHWHVIQRHVPANYKAVTTQMTEEIFVSTFIIGKRTAAARGNNIRIAIKKRVESAEGGESQSQNVYMYLWLWTYRDSVNRPVIDAGESTVEREALTWQ